MSLSQPSLLFLGDAPDALAAKVAQGVRDWRPVASVGQFHLPGGNAELARHSEKLVFDYLKTFTEVEIVNAARMSLFELLPRGDFPLSSLAASLDMADEDLNSQLKAKGISYQQLLGDTRRELAEEYIFRSDLSVNEIAYMLGFSDCSNFARSFRRWSGKSPSDFREDLHKSS